MRDPAEHTAEDASQSELRRASLKLALWLGLLLVLGPAVRALPLGQTTRTGILAWLLLAFALYWNYTGLGYRPLLLSQLGIFSMAVALLMLKILLVLVGIREFDVLRATGKALIVIGGLSAGANLGMMLVSSLMRHQELEDTGSGPD